MWTFNGNILLHLQNLKWHFFTTPVRVQCIEGDPLMSINTHNDIQPSPTDPINQSQGCRWKGEYKWGGEGWLWSSTRTNTPYWWHYFDQQGVTVQHNPHPIHGQFCDICSKVYTLSTNVPNSRMDRVQSGIIISNQNTGHGWLSKES